MAKIRKNDSGNLFDSMQNQSLADSALRDRKQRRTYRKVCSVLGIGLSIVMFYTLMKPAITMETNPGQDAPQLICQMEEHVHSDACWGYDHEESEPIYAVSRELNCQFVPHAHTEDCYDEEGSLICGISESYFHVHDENCYNQGNLVCTLEEHIREESNAEVPVLVCGQEEHEGHTHSQDCYTTTWFTDEDPICGLEEGGPHEHTEECLGLVLNCEKDHEHTDECFTVGVTCGHEAGEGHVHTLECYPSIRELNCDLEETEGHTHTEECYVMQKVETEDHIHSDACYENGRLICGKTEVWSHQHTDACWQEVQVLVSGGHVHNEECAKVLVCGLPEHEHTEACYRGNAEDIRKLLTENDTAAGEELLSEEKPEQDQEESSADDDMTMEAAGGQPEVKEIGAGAQAETQLSDQEVLAANGEALSEETTAGNENDLLWEDAYEEPLVAEVSGDESYDLVDEENPADEVNETEAEVVPDSEKTELENQETAAAVENDLQEEAGAKPETDDGLSEADKAQKALESDADSGVEHGDEGTTEASEVAADENLNSTQNDADLTADSFGSIHFVTDFEATEDGMYAVNLGPDEGVKVQDILAIAGIETEAYQLKSDIGFLEMGDDYFACRFAFEDDIVVITAGDQEIRVLCRFVKPEDSADGSDERTVDNGAAESADAESEGATDEAPEADAILLRGEGTDVLKAEMDPADKEAVVELVKQSMQDAADEEEIEQLIPDEETGSRIEADEKEETSGQIWKVIRVSSDEPYEGTMEITCPLKMAFRDMLPVGTRIVSVNYQLFQVNEETGEVSPVQDFVVDGDETEIRQIEFQAQSTGTWAFICSVEYEYIEYQLELNLDFSDFMADPDADMEETGIALIAEGDSERSENDAEVLPYGQRRKLARGSRQTMMVVPEAQETDAEVEQNGEEESAENREDTTDMSVAGISVDLSRLFSTLQAQGVDVEHEFEGIHVRIAGDGKPVFVPDDLNQESSDGQVSFDGQYLQILDNGTVVLKGKHLTVTIHVSGFEKPGMRSEVYVYTFTENQTVRMSEIFESVGFSDKFRPARFAYDVSDPNLVTLDRDGNDWIVTANNYFGEVELYVRRGWYSGTILLHNPVPKMAEGTEISADDGSVFMTLLTDTEIPYGTSLTAVPSEGRDISEQISEDFDPDREVNIKWFDISLGDLHDVHASVTLPGVIEVPEKAGRRVPTVNACVYHVTDEGVERLEAAVNGTDITFETDGFSEFAVVYTVDFHWEMNGETYEFTLPGGGAVSLTRLLSALGFQEMLASDDLENTVQTDEGNVAAKETVDGEVLVIHDAEDSGNESEEVAGNETDNSIGRNLQAFTEQIESVSFSDPALVWTGKVGTDTTVGQLKVDNALECLLSSDMTADMLEEANNMQIAAGDWAMISLMPFTSEESLTVTMKNGDVFVIRVTDAQIRKTVISASGEAYDITVTFDDDAGIPDTADLVVREIMEEDPEYAAYYAAASEHVNASDTESDTAAAEDAARETNGSGNARREIAQARFFDIEIWNDGSKIDPLKPVSVEIRLVDSAELADAVPEVLHFAKSGLESMDYTDKSTYENGRIFAFETDGFSVYSVIYTVDFEYSVNGKTYQFSLPGGGFVSLYDLIEVLGINGDTNSEENEDVNGPVIADNAEENAANGEAEESGVNPDMDTPLTLGDVEVSETTREFVADVASVKFSSPELVDVSKIESETTVGQIKESRGLECEYSAELTEEQIAEINAQSVEAGDWALISLKAFDTEESLTITMKNGEKFVIKVTDAQIQKDYITASGETYTIMVTYDNDAEIPDGADLKVREIEAGTKEFDNYLSSAASELEAQKVIFARFFDIVIADQEGNKVEPKAPVQVQICYKDPIGVSESEVLSVVHFTESSAVTAPEVITDITLSDDKTEVTYEQSSFSVTGTVVQSPTADHTYALVIHHTDGNYYVVENDCTLTQIKTEDLVFNGDGSVRSVKMINPICWTYQDIGYSNYNIWHDSDANDYDYDFTHLPTSYERRYLTTDVHEGFVDLDDDVNPWTLDNRSYCSDDGHYVNLQYNNDTHVINHYGHVLGVKQDTDGTLRICGQASEAAEIFFAEAQSVSSVSIQNHTVSHIDISVEGYSGIKVPLAYGTYRLAKVSEEDLANINNIGDINSHIIGYRALDLVVSHGSDVTLEAERMVPITQNDIKKANIYAYTEYTGERVYLDDVYAVTGYSGNADTGGSISKAQVRLEGSFKVADMQPVTYANTEQDANDWDYWENGQNTGKSIKEVRLERKIYYTVEVEKSVTFTMTYTDPSDGQVYIVMREDGNPFRVTVDTTLSNSFHYWDDDNTCPGIDIYGRDKWKEGALYSNIDSWQYHQSGGLDVGPGFDFELGAPIDEANHDIVAIEVTKYVQGDFGDEVRTLSLREGTSCGINVYQNNSLTPLHDKTLSVGKDGIGMINDYDVTAGTYDNPAYAQISEDPDTLADTIIDAEGNKWVYDHSRVETEFAYRNNGQINPSRYVSSDYTKENGLYYSQSEVIGEYTVQGGQPYDYKGEHHDGVREYNRFLEFYVYNIYKPVETDITIKKVNDNNQPLSGAVFELYKHNGSIFEKVTQSTYNWLDANDQFTVPAAGYTLTGLTNGTYKIKEITPPDGYVITEDTPVTFTVENGTVVEASNNLNNGATYTPAQDAVEDDPDTRDIDESHEAINDTFTIPNTPGAVLPNTGGPGTRLLTVLGSILILGAGVLQWRRRRFI